MSAENPESPQQPNADALPPGVTNREAWTELQALRQHPLLTSEARVLQTSIEGLEVDLLCATYALKMRIAPLPQREQDVILAKHTAANSLKAKLGGLTRMAYGGKLGKYVEPTVPVLDLRKAELVELFGKRYTAEDVHEVVTKQWGYQLSLRVVADFKARHLQDILTLQEKNAHDWSHLRLGYKPSRLEELQFMFKVRKDAYTANPSIANERQMQALLDQVRKEVEGEVSTVNLNANVTVQTLVDPIMRKQLMQSMSVLDIVIGRVAARMGRNPQFMISRLQSSMYAKFTGINTEKQEDMEQTPIYPSQYVYDFDKIKSKEAERKAEEQALSALPEIIYEEASAAVANETGTGAVVVGEPKPKALSIKARLLASLGEVKTETNRSIDRKNQQPGK